jgi:hypothetical protein
MNPLTKFLHEIASVLPNRPIEIKAPVSLYEGRWKFAFFLGKLLGPTKVGVVRNVLGDCLFNVVSSYRSLDKNSF